MGEMGKGGCRHIMNAQCSIFMGGKENGKWFDCHECYEEMTGRPLDLSEITSPLSLVCKSCRKLFQKDLHIFGDDDLTCPHCTNRPKPLRRRQDSMLPGEGNTFRAPLPRVGFVIPGMTPESVLIRECASAVRSLADATLDAPLRLDVDMALRFEHLVDYAQLPPSFDPNFESRLDALLHRRFASREATPMLLATDDMSRPESRLSSVSTPHAPRRPESPGGGA